MDFVQLVRTEDKYLITPEQRAIIEPELISNLIPCNPNPTVDFTIVKSVYFDSSDALFYRLHLAQDPMRMKLRMRTYLNDGIVGSNQEPYLELKEKDDRGRGVKTRLRLYTNDSRAFLNDDANDFVNRVDGLISQYGLKPVLSTAYQRDSWINDNSFRVTLDQALSWKPEGFIDSTDDIDWDLAREFSEKYQSGMTVMECKHDDGDDSWPDWFRVLISDLGLQTTKFSKYSWAMYQWLQDRS